MIFLRSTFYRSSVLGLIALTGQCRRRWGAWALHCRLREITRTGAPLICVARLSTLISRSAPATSSSASIRPICYGSTTTSEDVGDDNEPLLLKSALDRAYERMRLRGGLPPHINVASLHRLLMPGSGVPPPYSRFGWSTNSSRRYHHRRRRYSRCCRHSAAGVAAIDEDRDHHQGIPRPFLILSYLLLDSRRTLSRIFR